MYFELGIICVCASLQLAVAEDRWWCTTPNGEDGECVTLLACPPLMNAFANPKKGTEEHLKKFQCLDDELFVVCCGLSANFTIYKDTRVELEADRNITEKLQSLSNLKYCGFQHSDDYMRLENDTTRTADENPWLAVIFIDKPDKWGYGTGTLINRRYILTSTIYLPSFTNYKYYPVTARLGDYNVANDTDCIKLPQFDEECSVYQDYRIEEAIRHPFYSLSHGLHSLTLLRADEMVEFTDFIRPICLPIPGIKTPALGDTLHIAGWGLSDTFKVILNRKRFLVELVANDDCTDANATNYLPATEYNLCITEFTNSSEYLCYGDEGVPLMHSRKHQWFLDGMVLWWKHDGCRGEKPTITTKISPYLEWIQENIRP